MKYLVGLRMIKDLIIEKRYIDNQKSISFTESENNMLSPKLYKIIKSGISPKQKLQF